MHIAILGRQDPLSLAELESVFGSDTVTPIGDLAALVNTDSLDIQKLGGCPKAGRLVIELTGDWKRVSHSIEQHYAEAWRNIEHKITLGISAYGPYSPSPRQLQALGLALKKSRKHHPGSLRLIPNAESELSTATSHHNKLGLSPNKIELLVVKAPDGKTYLAESTGAQNITALAARDQARPRTDAFVGMLPPKLALMMINYAGGARPTEPSRNQFATDSPPPKVRQKPHSSAASSEEPNATSSSSTLLDPFCGTGVILQEALLAGYDVYGSDLSEKMVDYSQTNLEWLQSKHPRMELKFSIEQGDATKHNWSHGIDAVVCETYLGQPFSAPPSPPKLREVRGNCNHIISSFLKNIHKQIPSGTPLVLAVPAWKDTNGHFAHLPLIHQLDELGYSRKPLKHVRPDQLIYHRPEQVVARELLVITKD